MALNRLIILVLGLSKNNGKKSRFITIRVSPDEVFEAKEGYGFSNYQGSLAAYYRELLLGRIQHPAHINLEEEDTHEPNYGHVKDYGKVEGPVETRVHYKAVVTAAMMLRIKMDPDFRKYINAEPIMFQKLIDKIRGYTFDDDTELKAPLD